MKLTVRSTRPASAAMVLSVSSVPMAGIPETIRQASTTSASQAVTPSGSAPSPAPSTTSSGPSRSTPVQPFHSKGRASTPRSASTVSKPAAASSDARAAQGQAAPGEPLELDLGAQEEAAQAGHHGVAVAPVDIEHEALPVGAGHPQQGRQLAVGFEQQRVGGRPDGQRGHVLAQLALQVRLGVGPAHGQHVAAGPEGAGAATRSAWVSLSSGGVWAAVMSNPGRRRSGPPSCPAPP